MGNFRAGGLSVEPSVGVVTLGSCILQPTQQSAAVSVSTARACLGLQAFVQLGSLTPPFELNELQQFQQLICNMPWVTLHTWLVAPSYSQDFSNGVKQHLKLYRIRLCASHDTAGHGASVSINAKQHCLHTAPKATQYGITP